MKMHHIIFINYVATASLILPVSRMMTLC